jgi:predicted  nucleic acid-binding Zn-ribbon protein
MNHELERLLALQRLDSAAQDAHRRVGEEPERLKGFDARLDAVRQRLDSAKSRLADNQNARRAIEKDVAVQQARLSKFRDQLMSVKTNVEYQAMQKEIGFAQAEVKALEDKVLERMLEADELTAAAKQAEAELSREQKAVDADRRTLEAEVKELRAKLDASSNERTALIAALSPETFATFDLVSKRRNGVAMAEARDGVCTICHVRMRPQVFNNVRRNEAIIQCDSCQRILYFTPAPAAPNLAMDRAGPDQA